MYVSDDMVRGMIERYGEPETASFRFAVDKREYGVIIGSQKHGRNHDVTVYAFKGDEVIVIAKPFYPQGLFRAPSGGLVPGESFEDGIAREMHEETGCEIALEHFLLRTAVTFTFGDKEIDWQSFVFQARYTEGDFRFTDHREIREARVAGLAEFQRFSRIMRQSDVGGLHYRAALHEAVLPLLRL